MNREPLYVYVHINKCAGSTFINHAQKNLKPEELLLLYPNHAPYLSSKSRVVSHIEALSEREKEALKLIMGHRAFYGIHEFFPEREVRYVTFLREPFSRAVSEYNFGVMRVTERIDIKPEVLESLTRQFLGSEGKPYSFEEWVGKYEIYRNFMFKFLFFHLVLRGEKQGVYPEDHLPVLRYFKVKDADVSREHFEKVKSLLDTFYFIGLTSSEDDFVFLAYKLGFNKFFGRSNVSVRYLSQTDADRKRRKMSTHFVYDNYLYKYAQEKNSQFKAANTDYEKGVARMRLKKFWYVTIGEFKEFLFRVSAWLKKRSKLYLFLLTRAKRSLRLFFKSI